MELICSFFVASWTGVVKYHGPRPSIRPKQVFGILGYALQMLYHIFSFQDVEHHSQCYVVFLSIPG